MQELRHIVEAFKAKQAVSEAENFLFGAKSVKGLKVITASMADATADRLRKLGDFLRDKDSTVVAVIASVAGDKITFFAACGKDALSLIHILQTLW